MRFYGRENILFHFMALFCAILSRFTPLPVDGLENSGLLNVNKEIITYISKLYLKSILAKESYETTTDIEALR